MAHPGGVTAYVNMVGKGALTPGFRRYYEQRYEGSSLPSLGGWGSYSGAEQMLFHEHGDVAVAVKGGRVVNGRGSAAGGRPRTTSSEVSTGTGAPVLATVAAPNLGLGSFLGGVIRGAGDIIKSIIPGNLDDVAIDWITERVAPGPAQTAGTMPVRSGPRPPPVASCPSGFFRQGSNCVPLSTGVRQPPSGGLPGYIPTGIGPGAGIFDPLGLDLFTRKQPARQRMPQVAGGLPTPYYVETSRSECAPMPNGSRAVLYYSPMTQQEFCLPPGSQLAKASGLVRKWKPRPKAKLSAHDARMMKKYGKGGSKAKTIKALATEAGFSCKTR
jgi:hypothetical protein